MDASVFVDFWQMKCCGDPFQIGSVVRWTVSPWSSAWPDTHFPDRLARIDYREEHHGGADLTEITGMVTSIDIVRWGYEEFGGTWYPKFDSATLVSVDRADGSDDDDGDLEFVGYLVEIGNY